MAAHWPPVAYPTSPYADIPARLFRLPKILGAGGFCNPCDFYLLSIRRRRQGFGVRYGSRFLYNWA